MKKIFSTLLVMMCVVVAQAQMVVAPKMEKGAKHIYKTNTVSKANGIEFTTVSTISYVVNEKTADGYIVTQTMEDMSTSGGDENVRNMMSATQKMLVKVPFVLKTDKNGQVVDLVNFNESKATMIAKCNNIYDELIKANPMLSMQLTREAFIKQCESTMNVEALLQGIRGTAASVLTLNGKSINSGDTEEYLNSQGIKMKRTFIVSADRRQIESKATSAMTLEETKAFVIEQVEKNAPAQAATLKENIDKLVKTGMLKIDVKEDTRYLMKKDGWVDAIKYTQNMNLMGQTVSIETDITSM